MSEVTVRDLRNEGARVLERVARGETLTVTRAGKPIAELRPISRPPLRATTLLERYRHVPSVDAARLRTDVDALIDPRL